MIRHIGFLATAVLLATPLITSAQVLVNLVATEPTASELGPIPGTLRLSRDTDQVSSDLTVALEVSGTADCLSQLDCIFDPEWESASQGRYRWTIPAGQQSLDIRIVPIPDNQAEGDETVTLNILESGAYDRGPQPMDTVVVADDPPVVSLTAVDGTASEDGSDTGLYRLIRSGGLTDEALVVALGISGTADCINGTDCSFDPTWVLASNGRYRWEITAGEQVLDIGVQAVFDQLEEGDESVTFTVLSASTYELAAQIEATVTIADFVDDVFASGFEAGEFGKSGILAFAPCGKLGPGDKPDSRYFDLGTTVVDLATGRQWLRCGPAGRYDWANGSCVEDTTARAFLAALPMKLALNEVNQGLAGYNGGYGDWTFPVSGCLVRTAWIHRGLR